MTVVTTSSDTAIILNVDSTLNDMGEWDYTVSIDTVINEEYDTVSQAANMMVVSDEKGIYKFENVFTEGKDYGLKGYAYEGLRTPVTVPDLSLIHI